jgi:hypothetical protein
MSFARDDRKPCSYSGCDGTMRFSKFDGRDLTSMTATTRDYSRPCGPADRPPWPDRGSVPSSRLAQPVCKALIVRNRLGLNCPSPSNLFRRHHHICDRTTSEPDIPSVCM